MIIIDNVNYDLMCLLVYSYCLNDSRLDNIYYSKTISLYYLSFYASFIEIMNGVY